MLERKDKEMLLRMMNSRDEAKKEWLKNYLNGELQSMMAADKYDLTSHIKSQAADLEKLAKVVERLTQNAQELGSRFNQAEDNLRVMEDEAQQYYDERQGMEEGLQNFDLEASGIKDQIAAKREELKYRDSVIDTLTEDITMRDAEIERLSSILNEKDSELAEIEDRIRAAMGPIPSIAKGGIGSIYTASKGDAVDEYLAKYINMMQCQVPIKRLGNGYYLFGTRKIFAKIMNGKLVIRVGGGYMVIEEFIATYADQEINRCKLLEA